MREENMMDAREKWLAKAMHLAKIFLFEGRRNEDATPMLKQAGDNLKTHLRTIPEGYALVPAPEWVPVAERLPVVPEGKFSMRIWAFHANKGKVFRANWWQHHGFQKINFTHWMYRQDEPPAPPEGI